MEQLFLKKPNAKNFFGEPDDLQKRLKKMPDGEFSLFLKKMEERWEMVLGDVRFYSVFEDIDEARGLDARCMQLLYQEKEKRDKK